MSEYFPEKNSSGGRVEIELHLCNYATEADLKNATAVDTSKFAKKFIDIDKLKNVQSSLNNLKSKVDKLDIDKLVPFPVDLNN